MELKKSLQGLIISRTVYCEMAYRKVSPGYNWKLNPLSITTSHMDVFTYISPSLYMMLAFLFFFFCQFRDILYFIYLPIIYKGQIKMGDVGKRDKRKKEQKKKPKLTIKEKRKIKREKKSGSTGVL